MLRISSILRYILKGVREQNPRFIVKGDEHVIDTATGVTLHVYDNWFKLTKDDVNIVTKDDFTDEEQGLFWKIKKLITPAEVLAERSANYKQLQIDRRKKLSDLYENPTPMTAVPVQEEKEVKDYAG